MTTHTTTLTIPDGNHILLVTTTVTRIPLTTEPTTPAHQPPDPPGQRPPLIVGHMRRTLCACGDGYDVSSPADEWTDHTGRRHRRDRCTTPVDEDADPRLMRTTSGYPLPPRGTP